MGTQQDALAKQDLKNLILRDRKTNSKRTWRGSFLDYLELIRKNPSSAGLAHARIYEVITKMGSSQVLETDDLRVKRLYQDEPVPVYDFFQAEFFGVEKTVAQIVRYFRSAALKGEESRQVLYLMGPVGSGKSSLVQKIKSGLEEMGPFYAIENCPIHEETLHLLPRHLRPAFEEMLGVRIEGDLCPIFRTRLKQEFGIRYEEMPIVTREFSSRSRVGIAAVPPLRSPFWERDLRFRRRNPKLLFLFHRFVSTKYTSTEVVFISHDTEARKPPKRSSFEKVNQAEPLSLQATTRLSRSSENASTPASGTSTHSTVPMGTTSARTTRRPWKQHSNSARPAIYSATVRSSPRTPIPETAVFWTSSPPASLPRTTNRSLYVRNRISGLPSKSFFA